MPPKHRLIAACTLAFALSGCAEAPLAQLPSTHFGDAKHPCEGCQTSTNPSFNTMSKGITDSFHKLTGSASDPTAVPSVQPIAAACAPGPSCPPPPAASSFDGPSNGIGGSFFNMLGNRAGSPTLATGSPWK